MIQIKVEKLRDDAVLPRFATDGAACADLVSPCMYSIDPHSTKLIPLGFKVEIPYGYEMQIRPRSGLTLKHGIVVANSPGTVDSDFRGEIGVIIHNNTDTLYMINAGDRIAQAKISEVPEVQYIEGSVGETLRGAGGWGSTGK